MHKGKLVIGIAVLVCPYVSNCRILDISESGSVQAHPRMSILLCVCRASTHVKMITLLWA